MKKITKATYLKWYEDMFFWRKFEDKLAAVYIQQKVRGFLHLYNGQEAILAGALHVMELGKDRMITAYRNHVQPIGMGVDPKRVMAELFGKSTGTSMGLGGSMHIFFLWRAAHAETIFSSRFSHLWRTFLQKERRSTTTKESSYVYAMKLQKLLVMKQQLMMVH